MGEEHLSLQPGTVIAGRYEVVKCLGAGSMGLVYACRNRDLQGHMVAVKVLFPEVSRDKIAAARFRNEIFASYGVSHPNVVRAYEYLRDGDLVAYTMEYVGGGDLADRLGKPGDLLPCDEIMELLAQMCDGVQAIHDAGIVHRDLKPENILLTKDGRIKIADFGIARTGHGPKLTEHGGVVGTIDYVSPEYMLNSHVDWRSDIYALGILAYEMTTGESPFRGDSVYATMTKRLKTDPKRPCLIREEVPQELEDIIFRAMARDPEERYQSARQMGVDLRAYLGDEQPYSSASYEVRGPSATDTQEAEPPRERPAPDDTSSFSPFVEEPSATFISGAVEETPARAEPEDLSSPVPGGLSYELGGRSNLPSAELRAKSESVAPDYSVDEHDSPFSSVSEQPSFSEPVARPMPSAAEARPISEQFDSPVLDPRSPRLGPQSASSSIAIDSHRMKRLSDLADTVNRSLWVDLITWIAAIGIGIGVGFTTLKYVLPDIHSAQEEVAPDPSDELRADINAGN